MQQPSPDPARRRHASGGSGGIQKNFKNISIANQYHDSSHAMNPTLRQPFDETSIKQGAIITHMYTEPLSRTLKIKVAPSTAIRLDQVAALEGVSLSEAVRRLLDAALERRSELEHIRALILHMDGNSSPSGESHAIALESLLLLRAAVNQDKLRATQTDMRRLGVKPWST